MNLVFKVINFELYHIKASLFKLVPHYTMLGKARFPIEVIWNGTSIEPFNNTIKFIIPNYVIKRAKEVIPRYLEPFKKYDTVVYKDVEYTIVDTDGKIQINGEWKDCISYIKKYNKIKYHREKEDFIKKFKKI